MEGPYGRGYLVNSCLERTWFPRREEYRYVRYNEVYASKYDGTEKNRSAVQRTEEGYFLDNWVKTWEVQNREIVLAISRHYG